MSKKIEIWVGLFVAIGIAAFVSLALNVANTGIQGGDSSYKLFAKFDNIGGLKIRSPIKVGGVVVGRISDIRLDPQDYMPIVTLDIYQEYNQFSEATSLSILTAGLLGEQYIGLEPGFVDEDLGIGILQPDDYIEDTKSAIVLEELIGQFLFSQSDD